jgi:fumarate reductase subunit C
MVAWADALTAHGARVQIRTRRFARSQLVIAAWAVPTITALVVVLIALGVGSRGAGS